MLANLGSALAGLMFLKYIPYNLRRHVKKFINRAVKLVYPYIHITFYDYEHSPIIRSKAFAAVETYLHFKNSSASQQAQHLNAQHTCSALSPLLLTISEYEEVQDEFDGARFRWASGSVVSKSDYYRSRSAPRREKRYYELTFHERHRDLVMTKYLNHVMREGTGFKERNRQRRLYTNFGGHYWQSEVFDHPATFESIAMEAAKKQEIVDDLTAFSKAGDFYARIGKAWKRGYLLHGPPGTGKSTMIAAMANLLCYDVYDLELTGVEDKLSLRKLLINTNSKSLIVIEDIDCSLDLTGQRKEEKKKRAKASQERKSSMEEDSGSKVTLSGLLNFIDGLWSGGKGERLIVFTTNFKDKLDPALIRSGRMDKHVELSYCKSEAFRVLASNYWGLDHHPKFDAIEKMMEEIDVTPADVAECLMPKTGARAVDECLEGLIRLLRNTKEVAEAKKAAMQDEKKKTRRKEEEEEEEEEKMENRGYLPIMVN